MDLPQGLRHGVVAAAPDEDVSVGVAGDDVTGEAEREAGHVLRLVALIEQSGLAGEGQTEKVIFHFLDTIKTMKVIIYKNKINCGKVVGPNTLLSWLKL